jgi:hypothetical protein
MEWAVRGPLFAYDQRPPEPVSAGISLLRGCDKRGTSKGDPGPQKRLDCSISKTE